jgi:hypothetical protein
MAQDASKDLPGRIGNFNICMVVVIRTTEPLEPLEISDGLPYFVPDTIIVMAVGCICGRKIKFQTLSVSRL